MLARAGADRSGVSDSNINGAGIDGVRVGDVAVYRDLLEEVNVRVQDFWGFLPKSELISQIIIYESKLLLISHAIISTSIHGIDSSLSNTSYKDLTVVYLWWFYTHMLYFCKSSQSLRSWWMLADLKSFSIKPSKSAWNVS